MTTNKTYSELMSFSTFKERYEYLKMNGRVGVDTFGYDRYLNQTFYKSEEWKAIRRQVVLRDKGCEMALEGHEIVGRAIIHHLNPITSEDIINRSSRLFDMENLVLVSDKVHRAIHFGTFDQIDNTLINRTPGDTCPWRKG